MMERQTARLRFQPSEYPRKGLLRALRDIFLLCRWLLGVYAGAIAINLYVLFFSEPSDHTGQLEILHALLLPRWFADQGTTAGVYIGIAILLTALILGSVWATLDLQAERRVQQRARLAIAKQNIEKEIRREQHERQRAPQLLIMSIVGAYQPDYEVSISHSSALAAIPPIPFVCSTQRSRARKYGLPWKARAGA